MVVQLCWQWTLFVTTCCLAIAACDVLDRRIPNPIVAVTFLGGLLAALADGSLPRALAAAGLGLALVFVPYTLGWLGGGDVKAFAALCAFLSPIEAMAAFVCATLLGGVAACAAVAAVGLPWQRHAAVVPATIPYAVPLCGGCLWMMVSRAGF